MRQGEIQLQRLTQLVDHSFEPILNRHGLFGESLLRFDQLFVFVTRLFTRGFPRLEALVSRLNRLSALRVVRRRNLLAETFTEMHQFQPFVFRLFQSIRHRLEDVIVERSTG